MTKKRFQIRKKNIVLEFIKKKKREKKGYKFIKKKL